MGTKGLISRVLLLRGEFSDFLFFFLHHCVSVR